MATVKNSLKTLNFYFRSKRSDKLYRVRIKNPSENLSRETVQTAGNEIAQCKAFDFSSEGLQDPYTFVKATYYARSQKIVVK